MPWHWTKVLICFWFNQQVWGEWQIGRLGSGFLWPRGPFSTRSSLSAETPTFRAVFCLSEGLQLKRCPTNRKQSLKAYLKNLKSPVSENRGSGGFKRFANDPSCRSTLNLKWQMTAGVNRTQVCIQLVPFQEAVGTWWRYILATQWDPPPFFIAKNSYVYYIKNSTSKFEFHHKLLSGVLSACSSTLSDE